MRIAYFDCFAGISGDMALAALLDAGADAATLVAGLKTIPLPAWELHLTPVRKCGFAALAVTVTVGGEPAGHAHAADRHPSAHHHGTRFPDLVAAIRASELPDPVKERGIAVFTRLAEAEAKVHATALDAVHFHEVGAVDSIVDVVGTVYALHLLGVERVICSELPTGRGTIATAHGLLPVPAPATAELLRGVPLRRADVEAELTTPTGAALATTLASEFGASPSMRLLRTGVGAGQRDLPFPNLLRVFLGEAPGEPLPATTVTVLEANLDDLSPQLYERVIERLFAAGALDVTVQPVQMKKNRPAHTLSAICPPEATEAVLDVFFRETTTLGVRMSEWRRVSLAREWIVVTTPYGDVRVKLGRRDGEVLTVAPEYDDCLRLARERDVPLKEIHAAASALAWDRVRGGGS